MREYWKWIKMMKWQIKGHSSYGIQLLGKSGTFSTINREMQMSSTRGTTNVIMIKFVSSTN